MKGTAGLPSAWTASGFYQGIEGDFQQLRGKCWLENKTNTSEWRNNFVHDRLGDVTFLSLVLVEKNPFDAAGGL